jgi:hypothetical protein
VTNAVDAGSVTADTLEATGSITDPEGNTVTSLSDPVRVTEEASTFVESDVTVTFNNTTNIGVGSTASRPADDTTESGTNPTGIQIEPQKDIRGVRFTASGNTQGATRAQIKRHSDGSVVASQTGLNLTAGDTVEFPNTSLSSGVRYQVVVDAEGSSYDIGYEQFTFDDFPFTSTDVYITNGIDASGSIKERTYNIVSVSSLTSLNKIELSNSNTSGDALISFDSGVPADIDSWDLATFQRTLDGETVTVDVETLELGTINDFESGDLTVEASNWADWSGDTGNLSAQQTTVLSENWSGEFTSANENVRFQTNRSSAITPTKIQYDIQMDNRTGNSRDRTPQFNGENGAGTIGIYVGFYGDGSIESPFGTQVASSGTWSANTQYRVTLDNIDFLNGTYDLTITDVGAFSDIVSETGVVFDDSSVSDLATLEFANTTDSSTETVNLYIDSVQTGILADVFTDISQNFDISTIDTSKNVRLRANLSRNDTANNPTVDYLSRRFTR